MGYVHMLSLDLEHEDFHRWQKKPCFLVTPLRLIGNPDQSPWTISLGFSNQRPEAEENNGTDFEKENDLNQTFMTLKDGGWPFSNSFEHSSVFFKTSRIKDRAGDNLANLDVGSW